MAIAVRKSKTPARLNAKKPCLLLSLLLLVLLVDFFLAFLLAFFLAAA
jgi:hypothetical protein